jgi:hypothetical protein
LYKWEQEVKEEKARERTKQTKVRADRYLYHFAMGFKMCDILLSIKEKLRGLGWDDKYFPNTDPEWCRLVAQPRPLNERGAFHIYTSDDSSATHA